MIIRTDDKVLFPDIKAADSFILRFLGLMPRRGLKPSEGLLLINCGRIHTCFMRFTIDAVYLSEDYTVLDIETVSPWRVGRKVRGARHVLEVSENGACMLKRGDRISSEY